MADVPDWFGALIAFLFGASIGSFVNVVAYRLPREISIATPRSFCAECNRPLPRWANIPILAYLGLRGRCLMCGATIPFRHFMAEFALGVTAAYLYVSYPLPDAFARFVFCAALFIIALIDYDWRLIPNIITFPGIPIGLLAAAFMIPEVGLKRSLIGIALGWGFLFLTGEVYFRLRGREGVGMGDVWLLGEHRLLCGDATSRAAIDTVLEGGHADMVFTDPSYNVAYEGKTNRKLSIMNDDLGKGFFEFLRQSCAHLIAVCRGAIYVCMSSSELHTLYRAFTEAGGHWSTFLIWAKDHFTLGRSDYQRQWEAILYGWPEGAKHYWCRARNQGDVWMIPRPTANREHPTMKPVELVERALDNSSRRGNTVLDPFAGSGTTLIACQRRNRKACLIELDPRYVDVICQRWQQYSGISAIRQADGRPFAQLKLPSPAPLPQNPTQGASSEESKRGLSEETIDEQR